MAKQFSGTRGAARLRRLVLPPLPSGDRVPKVIHQTFRSRDLRPELAANIAEMQRRNPDWEYRLYDDADITRYVVDNFGADVGAYLDAINPKYGAAKADLFRYLLMYREGGAYLDIKSCASRPLSDVILPSDRFLISQWNSDNSFSIWGSPELKEVPGGEYQQWFIIAAPGHPFLKAAAEAALRNLRRYSPIFHSVGKPAVLRTTGPIAFTRAIHRIRHLHPHRLVDGEADLGFSYSIYPKQDHEAALGAHYSEVGEALVGDDPVTAIAVGVRRCARMLRRALAQRTIVQA
jgi:inositol phosphorylceramide mannosyltransferase catalytic subunit